MPAFPDPSLLIEAQQWIAGSGRVLLRLAAALFLTYLISMVLILLFSSLRDAIRLRGRRTSNSTPTAPLALGGASAATPAASTMRAN